MRWQRDCIRAAHSFCKYNLFTRWWWTQVNDYLGIVKVFFAALEILIEKWWALSFLFHFFGMHVCLFTSAKSITGIFMFSSTVKFETISVKWRELCHVSPAFCSCFWVAFYFSPALKFNVRLKNKCISVPQGGSSRSGLVQWVSSFILSSWTMYLKFTKFPQVIRAGYVDFWTALNRL